MRVNYENIISTWQRRVQNQSGALECYLKPRLNNILLSVLRVIATQARAGTLHFYLPTPTRGDCNVISGFYNRATLNCVSAVRLNSANSVTTQFCQIQRRLNSVKFSEDSILLYMRERGKNCNRRANIDDVICHILCKCKFVYFINSYCKTPNGSTLYSVYDRLRTAHLTAPLFHASSKQWCQFRAAQRWATDGRGTRTRKTSDVHVSTAFRLSSLIEEYRHSIFFPTSSRHTIVDSPRDFKSSIAWCKQTIVISLQRAIDSLAHIRTSAFLRVRKRKPNECSDPYKCTFLTLFSFFVLLYLLKCLSKYTFI